MGDIAEIAGRVSAHLQADDRSGAVAALLELAHAGAADKSIQLDVITRLHMLGALDHAVTVATAALARFPESPGLHLGTANVLLAANHVNEAATILGTLCQKRPDLADVWARYAAATFSAGRFEQAYAAYSEALRRTPEAALLWNGLADAAMRCNRNEEALIALRRSLKLEPAQAAAAGQLGRLLLKRGDLDEAAHWLDQSAQIDPTLVPSLLNLTVARLSQRRLKAALIAANTAVQAGPEHAQTHAALGQVLTELEQHDAAAAAFMAALERNPNYAEAVYGLARAHGRAGRLAKAVAVVDRYLVLRPDDAQAQHMRRAWARAKPGAAPTEYVRRLFDAMAADFDVHLQGVLSYDTPEQAGAMLKELYPAVDRFAAWCDIGCGTGLMASALASRYDIAERIGVDLSAAMLAKAEAKGLYTQLVTGEGVAGLAALGRRFDLITAMDVLIYIGDAQPFLAVAAARLNPGGILAVSLETGDGITDVRLELTARFTHNIQHFTGLAVARGLKLAAGRDIALRSEAGAAVRGYLAVFERE